MKSVNFLKKSENTFYLNKLTKLAKKVLALETTMADLSDAELQQKTVEFKNRLQSGEKLKDILVEAFAVCREASTRVLKMKHYLVQIIGGVALNEGNIAEMATGEGKTLVGTLPAYLNALTGDGVHIVTVNEYLAKRDHDILAPLYHFLGLTTSVITGNMPSDEKRQAYEADIVYITNTELGFDYLRDNMVMDKEEKVQRKLNFCIIDEVDSVLLDDARTPLIISGQGDEPSAWYHLADMFARSLTKKKDFTLDEEIRAVMLTEEGLGKAEMMFRLDNFADEKNMDVRFYVEKALNAHYIMKRDKDYIIHNNEIKIIDESTGRVSEGRRFSQGLHQALEAKEGVAIQKENKTLATITYQNFFLLYEKLSGMTGTAATEDTEFREIYGLNVVRIPTNRPIARKDLFDKLYLTESAKNKAIVEDIKACYQSGQPVLVGTSSIEKSERISRLLQMEGIPHVVLNAKNHEKEAGIVENAGQKHVITIATNMAGRGTDIKLGEGVKELGGLKVIGTERASNRRIDNQLSGRSGRQGDPGVSQFYLSFDDDLLRIFTSEGIRKRVGLMAQDDDSPIEMKMLIKSIHSAQERLEGTHFEMRKQTIEYDSINNEQRVMVYQQRDRILEDDFDIIEQLRHMATEQLNNELERIALVYNKAIQGDDKFKEATEQLKALCTMVGLTDLQLDPDEITEDQKEVIQDCIEKEVNTRLDFIKEMYLEDILRRELLQTVDQTWMEHLNTLDNLKEQVKFAGYKQVQPIQEYGKVTFDAFNAAMDEISRAMMLRVMQIQPNVTSPLVEVKEAM